MTAEQYVARDCPDCGRVSVRTDRIRRTSTASGVREQWPCSVCGRQFSRVANAAGTVAEVPADPLTEDDLIAFGLALEASPSAERTSPAERTTQ